MAQDIRGCQVTQESQLRKIQNRERLHCICNESEPWKKRIKPMTLSTYFFLQLVAILRLLRICYQNDVQWHLSTGALTESVENPEASWWHQFHEPVCLSVTSSSLAALACHCSVPVQTVEGLQRSSYSEDGSEPGPLLEMARRQMLS